MIVCHCTKTTCREVEQAIKDGARTVEDIGRKCGAGRACGGCKLTLQELLDEYTLTEKLKRWIKDGK